MSWRLVAVLLAVFAMHAAIGDAIPCQTCDALCYFNTSGIGGYAACRCDPGCEEYGDCCETRPPECAAPNTPSGRRYECVNVPKEDGSPRSVWMVIGCPGDWDSINGEGQFVLDSCLNGSQLFPVTDNDTGIVYRNTFCAMCHGVQNLLTWRFTLMCDDMLNFILHVFPPVTLEDIIMYCRFGMFDEPNNGTSILRECNLRHAPLCQDQAILGFNDSYYESLVEGCMNGFENLVQEIGGRSPEFKFRNEYCALCNGIGEVNITCAEPPNTLGFMVSFTIVLDVNQDGISFTTLSETYTVNVSCEANEVFDPVTEQCRETIESILEGLPATQTNFNCTDTLIALGQNDTFEMINSSTILYNDDQYQIAFINTNQEPVICVNFTQNGTQTVNTTVISFTYPLGITIITYVGCSLSVIGCLLLLLTYCCFRELLTLPSKILMNLAIAIMVADLLLIVGVPIVEILVITELCIAIAVSLHFFFLALFSWMTILCFEMMRTFYNAHQMKPVRPSTTLFVIYVFLGWGLPFLIVGASLIANFVTDAILRFDNLVLYGVLENGMVGSCWINHFESAIVAFIAPVTLSLLLNLIFFTVIVVLLCLAVRSQTRLDKDNKNTPYIRVVIAIFFVSGLTWGFGFLAILIGTAWSWYPYILLNSTQGLVIFLAFLCTKKVGGLYLSICRKGGKKPATKTTKLSTKQSFQLSDVSENTDIKTSIP